MPKPLPRKPRKLAIEPGGEIRLKTRDGRRVTFKVISTFPAELEIELPAGVKLDDDPKASGLALHRHAGKTIVAIMPDGERVTLTARNEQRILCDAPRDVLIYRGEIAPPPGDPPTSTVPAA